MKTPQYPPKRTFLRRSLLLLGKLLAGLLLVLALVVGGGVLWLRSDSGEKFVLTTVVDILASQGLYLTAGDISGPLPQQLTLRAVTLADKHGVFAKADALRLEIALGELFRGTIAVPEVLVQGPELLRLPELPPSEETPAQAFSAPSITLPVALRVDSLRVAEGIFHTAALQDQKTSQANAEASQSQNDIPVGIDVQGDAQLASGQLTAHLSVTLKHPDGDALAVKVTLNGEENEAFVPNASTLAAKLQAEVHAKVAEQTHEATLALDAALTGASLAVNALHLDGIGIALRADGTLDCNNLTGKGQISLDAADRAPWQAVLAQLAQVEPEALPMAGLALTANLSAPDNAPMQADVVMQATAARWQDAMLDDLLGASVKVSAALSAPDASHIALELKELTAGLVHASGKASIALPEPATDNGVRVPTTGSATAAKGHMEAAFSVAVKDVAPLREDLSGAVAFDVQAKGWLDALTALATVRSANLQTGAGDLEKVLIEIATTLAVKESPKVIQGATVDTTPDAARNAPSSTTPNVTPSAPPVATSTPDINASGTFKASLGNSPGGPLTTTADWKASVTKNAHQLAASLANLTLHGGGMDATGHLSVSLPLVATNATPAIPPVTGAIKAKITSWETIAALSGVPLDGGIAALDLLLEQNNGKQAVSLDLQIAALSMREPAQKEDTFSLQNVSTKLTARNLPDAPFVDMRLTTGEGSAGGIRWKTAQGRVDGNEKTGTFSLGVDGSLLDVQGRYDIAAATVTLDRASVKIPEYEAGLQLRKPATLTLAETTQVRGLDVAFIPSGSLTAEASFAPSNMTVQASLKDLPFSVLSMVTNSPLPGGTLNADIACGIKNGKPSGDFTIASRISDATGAAPSGKPLPALDLQLQGRLTNTPGTSSVAGSSVRALPGILWLAGSGSLESATTGTAPTSENHTSQITFHLPLRVDASGIPLPDSRAPLAARFLWDGDLAALWQLVPLPDRYLSGRGQLDVGVAGTMSAPKMATSAYIAGGKYKDNVLGVLLTDISLEASSTPEGVIHALLAAQDEQKGTVALEASLLPPQGKNPATIAVRGQLQGLEPLHRDDLSIRLSGLVGVQGSVVSPEITADLVLEKGEFSLAAALGGGSVATLDVTEKKERPKNVPRKRRGSRQPKEEPPPGPQLDAKIAIQRHFFIRGMGMDSEWQGQLRIAGSADAPALTGSLSPVRGYFDLLSKPFEFTEGEITFTGGSRINPAINLVLTHEGPSIVAIVRATGTANKPTLTLESRPPLPQDEVLAQVLFGKRLSDLSRVESLQLANSLRELTSTGSAGFNPLTSMRKELGLDVLRVGSSQAQGDQRTSSNASGESNLVEGQGGDADDVGGATLEAGKYINDSIYIGVEQGATQESTAVRVEVELSPHFSLQGRSATESTEVGVGWKMDY